MTVRVSWKINKIGKRALFDDNSATEAIVVSFYRGVQGPHNGTISLDLSNIYLRCRAILFPERDKIW